MSAAIAGVLLTGGCGVAPSGVHDGGHAPTGLASGATLYFLDEDARLQPSVRKTERLGTVLGAVQLLMAGVSGAEADAGLHSDIPSDAIRAIVVDTGPQVEIALPFDDAEISRTAVDQVICTALGVTRASGREGVRVSVRLTSGEEFNRGCPALR